MKNFDFDANYEEEPSYLVDWWGMAVWVFKDDLRDDWKTYSSYKAWMKMVFGEEELVVNGLSVSRNRVKLETLMYGKKGTERPHQKEINYVTLL